MQRGRRDGAAELDAVWSRVDRDVRFAAVVGQGPVLADRGRRVVQAVRARQIGEVIATHEGVGGEQRVVADDMRVARRDVERLDVLVLGLQDLVVGVRDVEARLRRLDIQVKRAVGAWLGVEAVEEADVVPGVVERLKFRRVEKPIRLQARDRDEVADRFRPAAQVQFAARAS